ncbi:uncharacterized protein BDZ99DRAFT_458878, partial [Mytilinidion resinicola]
MARAKNTLTAVKICGLASAFRIVTFLDVPPADYFANFVQLEELSIDMGGLLNVNHTVGPLLPALLPRGLKALKLTYCHPHDSLFCHLRALYDRAQAGSFPYLKSVHVDFEYSASPTIDLQYDKLLASPTYALLKTGFAECDVDFATFDYLGRSLTGNYTTKHYPQVLDQDRGSDWWWPLPHPSRVRASTVWR